MPLAITFRIQNIIDHGGIPLSIAGLVVVFIGLTLVTLFIQWLPNMLAFFDRIVGKAGENSAHGAPAIHDTDDTPDRDIAVAIATVLERELTPEDGSAIQRITIRRGPSESLWRNAYRIRTLSAKTHPPKARQ
jgi:Na+-transporting methylmalonyl-CoA/oxaloacetate decarboxylase gamma subunit